MPALQSAKTMPATRAGLPILKDVQEPATNELNAVKLGW
jgi:hypothetical protein